MTKTALITVMLLCTAVFAQRGGRSAVNRELPTPTAAVYVTGSLNESEKEALGSRILSALVMSGRFAAGERSSTFAAAVGKEPPLRSDGSVDDRHIGLLGRQAGLRYVCIAGVSPSASGFYTVAARMLDIEKGKVTASGRTYGQLNNMLAIDELAVDIAMEVGIGVYQSQLSTLPAPFPPELVTAISQQQPVVAAPPPQPQPAAAAPTPPPIQPVTAAPAPPLVQPVTAAPVPPPIQPVAPAPAPQPIQPVAAAPAPPPVAAAPALPANATISIATHPSHANIYIGERFIGRSNDGELNVPAGVHQVRFIKDNIDKTQTMTFNEGRNATTFVALGSSTPVAAEPEQPLEDIGASIIIHTRPPEADVYVDGKLVGKSNQSKLSVPIGTHDVKFIKDGLEKTEAMTFQAGENPTKVVTLDDGKQKKKSKSK